MSKRFEIRNLAAPHTAGERTVTFATDSAREAAAEWLGLGQSVRWESVLLDAEGGVRPLVVDVGPDWWRIAYLDGGTIEQDNRPIARRR